MVNILNKLNKDLTFHRPTDVKLFELDENNHIVSSTNVLEIAVKFDVMLNLYNEVKKEFLCIYKEDVVFLDHNLCNDYFIDLEKTPMVVLTLLMKDVIIKFQEYREKNLIKYTNKDIPLYHNIAHYDIYQYVKEKNKPYDPVGKTYGKELMVYLQSFEEFSRIGIEESGNINIYTKSNIIKKEFEKITEVLSKVKDSYMYVWFQGLATRCNFDMSIAYNYYIDSIGLKIPSESSYKIFINAWNNFMIAYEEANKLKDDTESENG